MAQDPAEAELLSTSAVLEAIRPQFMVAIGRTDQDQVLAAWTVALRRYLRACDLYAKRFVTDPVR